MNYLGRKSLVVLVMGLLLAACDDKSPGGETTPPTPTPPTDPAPGVQPPTPNPGSNMTPPRPGQTEFTTEVASTQGGPRGASDAGASTGAGGAAGNAAPPAATPTAPGAAPPGGRNAEVEEGDIYKVDGNRLFYLNTYRGFVAYDVNDPKNPRRMGRLPVFGYPVEMFVSGNTVHALLRDALYLTQVGDNLQYERHNVSQLVTIDITDLANPRVLRTIDIVGELREGVSRKVENSIYVVSYIPQSYYWGWRPDPTAERKEQAWVHAFDVSDRDNVHQVGEALKIFEGGSVQFYDERNSFNRTFSDVAISATANALMVVENWNVSAYSADPRQSAGYYGCGSYSSTQLARVSLIDISDPSGAIKVHAKFETKGHLNDQFKMTYVNDPLAGTGTFYGIFDRQVWQSAGCNGNSYTQNTLESWDVSVAGAPTKLDTLDFGKPNEVVRASAYDTTRNIVYAITAQRIDPLYALSFENRADLRVRSSIDGLSGEMSVFRLVGDKKFLLAVGTDTSGECLGFQDGGGGGWNSTRIAVSLIDVQNLDRIRLIQRQCVKIEGADWQSSGVTANLDQAHKMLGMHADGSTNVITVPVSYSKRIDSPDTWWWYRWETAVGMMTWDLTRYDPALPVAQQQVIKNFGTFIHPHGEVRRSIVFTHQGATPARMMINLSDTHISVANIQDLDHPTLESEIELAPYYNQIYRFGDYLVEQVQSKPNSWGTQEVATFRVKRAGGPLDDATPVASFDVGQVNRVLKHDKSLVLFRTPQDVGPYGYSLESDVQIVDLSDPTHPRLAGHVRLPTPSQRYYPFFCGMGAYWGSFWFDDVSRHAVTDKGFAFYVENWRWDGNQSINESKLVVLDVSNPDVPGVSQQNLPAQTEWGSYGMVPDPLAPSGFFVSTRKSVGTTSGPDGSSYTRYKYYAQRWTLEGGRWAAREEINIPGRLIRTFANAAGVRMYLAQDQSYRQVVDGKNSYWLADQRLWLLKATTANGKPAAELMEGRVLADLYPTALLVDDGKLIVSARPQLNYAWYGPSYPGAAVSGGAAVKPPGWEVSSDRLLIFDLSADRLTVSYDQPTRIYNMQLMGTHEGRLFINLSGGGGGYYYYPGGVGGGDGILVVDVADPAKPVGIKFLRTLGYATHIEFFGGDVYVASGHFGLTHLNLTAAPEIPPEPGI